MTHQVRSVLARLSELLRRRRIIDDLDEELRLHLEMEVEHNVARGMAPGDARRAALIAFGGVQRFREEAHDARGFAVLDNIARDLRFALRRLRRAPTFAVGAIATLAIGIAAVASIGALVYGVVFRPLPYAHPETLVRVSFLTPGLGTTSAEHSDGTFLYFRERSRSFAQLGAYYENDGITISDGDEPERVTAAMVTPSIFSILGTSPAIGQLFSEDDAQATVQPVLVSYGVWMRRFGGDPRAIGKTIEVNRSPRVIKGVLPRGFDFPSPSVSVWYPSNVKATRAGLNDRYRNVIGRLAPGVTPRDAEAELRALTPHLPDRFPDLSAEALRQSGATPIVQTLRTAIVEPVRSEMTLLGAMVLAVLLIATTNVGTLFLLRAERLRGEVAVSRALGASGGALVQRFVVEGLVVALLGAVVSLPLVAISLSTKFGFTAGQIPRLHEISLDRAVVVGMFAVAACVGVALGLGAAARVSGSAAAETMGASVRSTASRHWRRAQQALVVIQVAAALSLLLGATLMGESLLHLRHVNLGFTPQKAITFELVLPFSPYPRYQRTAEFHFRVMEALRALPGVSAASAAMSLPLTASPAGLPQRLQSRDATNGGREVTADANVVPAEYFRTIGIPIRAGRSFLPGDLTNANPGIIVSAALARELFGQTDPIGREVRIAERTAYPPYRVVGVAGDVYGERIPDGVTRLVYFPLLADLPPASSDMARIPFNPTGMHFVVRSNSPVSALVPAIRRIVSAIDARVPVTDVTTLEAIVARATARARLTMLLLGVAAAAALLLGAVGLYSVISYTVAGRSQEFSIRVALGATAAEITSLAFREGLAITSGGVAFGLVASLIGSRLLRGALYEVSPTNPVAYVIAAAGLLLASIAATYLPARRAGRADPAAALRGV